jgi:hypothetical protein
VAAALSVAERESFSQITRIHARAVDVTPLAFATDEAVETCHNPRCDLSLDDNCDDSCSPSDPAYTTICGLSCLVTASARSWQLGGSRVRVPLAPLYKRGPRRRSSNHCSTVRRVFVYALFHATISSNPTDRVDFPASRATGRRERFKHHPLTAEANHRHRVQCRHRYPVYALLTYFAAYTGLRAAELAGLDIGDLTFAPGRAHCLACDG